MGPALATVLVNIFIRVFKPKFYLRYVDDILAAFHESKWLNEYNLNKPKFYC